MLAVAAVGWKIPGVQNLLTTLNSLGKRSPNICAYTTTLCACELCRVALCHCFGWMISSKYARCCRKHWWRYGVRDSLSEALLKSAPRASGSFGLIVMGISWLKHLFNTDIQGSRTTACKIVFDLYEYDRHCMMAAVQVGNISIVLWANQKGVMVCRRELCRCYRDTEWGKQLVYNAIWGIWNKLWCLSCMPSKVFWFCGWCLSHLLS